ncbi:MAG: hypothetical protein ACE5EL_05065, partial [Anaerolineae bacterium]
NHEGSQIPRTLLTAHPNLHVFHEPMTVGLAVAGVRVDVAGFPFSRAAAREIGTLVRATGATGGAGATGDAIRAGVDADIRLLCIHQAVEGAQVGVANYTFRSGADVVPGHAVPQGFAAVLAGHIHRGQVLRRDLGGRPLACPVVYPGSVERTSFAEREETKGYATLTVIAGTQGTAPAAGAGGSVAAVRFHPLPARPMHVVDIDPRGMGPGEITHRLRSELAALPADAVVRVRLSGPVAPDAWPAVAAARVRSLAPPTMNVSVGHPTGLAPSGLGR